MVKLSWTIAFLFTWEGKQNSTAVSEPFKESFYFMQICFKSWNNNKMLHLVWMRDNFHACCHFETRQCRFLCNGYWIFGWGLYSLIVRQTKNELHLDILLQQLSRLTYLDLKSLFWIRCTHQHQIAEIICNFIYFPQIALNLTFENSYHWFGWQKLKPYLE